jgi:hypothetical protein
VSPQITSVKFPKLQGTTSGRQSILDLCFQRYSQMRQCDQYALQLDLSSTATASYFKLEID